MRLSVFGGFLVFLVISCTVRGQAEDEQNALADLLEDPKYAQFIEVVGYWVIMGNREDPSMAVPFSETSQLCQLPPVEIAQLSPFGHEYCLYIFIHLYSCRF